MPNNYTRPSYYEKVSELGKPILEILCSEIKDNCFDTIHSEEDAGRLRFDGLNAVKYLWRLGQKGTKADARKDLQKAIDYLESEALRRYNVSRVQLERAIFEVAFFEGSPVKLVSDAWTACQLLLERLPLEISREVENPLCVN